MAKPTLLFATACALLAAAAGAHPVEASNYLETASPYVPYEFLIGNWYSPLPGSNLTIRQQFKWGPAKSYISYATYMAEPGKPEHLHFEGIMVWNGKSKALDFLFAVEPPSGVEEKGTVKAEADGTIIRDVEMTDAKGAVSHFRQTFRSTGANSAVTSLLRQTDKGWTATMPGSEELNMTRRD